CRRRSSGGDRRDEKSYGSKPAWGSRPLPARPNGANLRGRGRLVENHGTAVISRGALPCLLPRKHPAGGREAENTGFFHLSQGTCHRSGPEGARRQRPRHTPSARFAHQAAACRQYVVTAGSFTETTNVEKRGAASRPVHSGDGGSEGRRP